MKRIRHPNESFDAYVGKLPEEEGEELRKQVFCDARDEVFLRNWVTNDIEYVSATEVSNHIASVQHYNERVVALNSESKKRAAAAKAEILAGASFYEVATNRTDIFLEDARFWDVVEIGEFEPDEDIFKFLASAKAGDISDPLDLDDGIGIVGVLQKEQEKQEDGTVSDLYTLVRCMFNGYDAIEESDDVESVRKLLLERKMNDAKQALLTELFTTAKIEYPFGNKLFLKKKVKRTKKPPQKAARPNKKQPEVKPVPRGAKPVSAKGGVPTKRTVPAKGM